MNMGRPGKKYYGTWDGERHHFTLLEWVKFLKDKPVGDKHLTHGSMRHRFERQKKMHFTNEMCLGINELEYKEKPFNSTINETSERNPITLWTIAYRQLWIYRGFTCQS